MKENNKKAVLVYRKLSPLLQMVIRILAVQVFEFRQKDLFYCLNILGLTDNNEKPFVLKTLQPILKELEAKGLILKTTRGIMCLESIRQEVLKDVLLENQFDAISSVVLKADPFKPYFEGVLFSKLKEFYKALLISIFGEEKYFDVDMVYLNGQYLFPYELKEDPPFLKLFNRPFYPELFDCLSPSMRLKTLAYIMESAENGREHVNDAFEYCIPLLSKVPGMENEKYMIMESLLWCGRIKEHKKILKKMEDPTSYYYSCHMGWVMMICNQNEKALMHFNDALAILKKTTRKRKIFLSGNVAWFFLFALLKSQETQNYEAALVHIEIAIKDDNAFLPLFLALKSIFLDLLGRQEVVYGFDSINRSQNDLISFFSILVTTWQDKQKAQFHIETLEDIRKNAIAAGHSWLQAETCALLADLGHDAKINREESLKIHQKCNTTSFTNIVKSIPKWEKILNSLIRMGENADTAPGLKNGTDIVNQRLIWILSYNEQYNACGIAPRLQKLSKSGIWTKGRAVGLKNLYKNRNTMEGLTDQDRQVAGAITERSYRGGYRSYYQVEYYFDDDRALPALAGHPFIFLEDSLASPVELVMGEPEVRLRRDKEKIMILMHPRHGGIERFAVVRETPSRFKLVRFSAEQSRIAKLLGENGLELPEKAKEMAGQAVTSLSSIIQINSDLALAGNGQASEIKADPIPHVHVMPWQEGINVEFLVRPFTDTGSYFKPGRGGGTVFAEVNGEKVQAVRNLDKEKEMAQDVVVSCPTLDLLEEVGGQWLVGDPETALELLLELKNSNEKLVMEWPRGEKIKVRSQVSFNDFKLNIKKDREWFKATGTLDIDKDLSLDLVELMKMLDKPSGRFVTLDDGTFLAITQNLKHRLDELKAYSKIHGKGLRFAPLAAPAIEEFMDQAGSLKSDKAWKQHCKKLKEVVNPGIPGTLQASLRDYQKVGFSWLAQLAHWNVGACLADDMGLGKTVQALAAILLHAGNGPTLVVAPLSVMGNWQDECKSFAPTLNPLVFGPGDRKKFLKDLGPFDLVISSYGLLQVEEENLSSVQWQTLVLDEAQAIKNMKTKRSKAAMKLNAGFRIITTGTPVENHLDELWTLFNFLNPGLLGGYQQFKNTFGLPIERDNDKDAASRLRKLIRPFILRRLKTEVLKELPEKTEITLSVEMSRDETVLYEAQRHKAIENIENADDKGGQKHLRILAELTRLRQICCNPSLVLPDAGIESSKLKVFGNVVEELLENKHKALVFSQFVGHLSILREFLDKKNISYQYLDGSTPVKKRKERIKSFQNGERDLFLISLKAGGFGLNLTAADYVIHMDPWWNPAVEDQASDRVHRIGQTRPVTVYRLVVKNSIEEQIVNLHKEKRDLAQSLLAGSDTAGKINSDDLLALLKGNT